jgi:hypothetical protein
MTHRTTSELLALIKKSKRKKCGAKIKYYAEIDGETRSLQQWAKDFDLHYDTVLARFKAGRTGRELIAPERKKTNNFL